MSASGGLLAPLFAPDAMLEAVSDHAWLQAMLDFEAALAAAQARAGAIPGEAADRIAECCRAERFDPDALGRDARASGTPVVPLVGALRDLVGGDAAGHVHQGATSQDVMDTAAMLVARRALALIAADLDAIAAACAGLADEHRGTLMAGRTLLQQALPTTFGLKAAGWLVAVLEARGRLLAVHDSGLAVQLGGAAGTLASQGPEALTVLANLAAELSLAEPIVPWHTARARVADLGAALAVVAGTLGKVALDVALLAQTEVGEVAEPSGEGRGGSSALPHKRNPIGSALTRACARRVQGLTGTLLGALEQEHERAAGAWHAEWEPLREALAATGGAAASLREVLEGLEVRPDRMRANLELTGGLLLSERVAALVAERGAGAEGRAAVEAAAGRAAGGGHSLREELEEEPAVRDVLSGDELERALDPAGYVGAAEPLVERALEAHRREAAG